MKLTPQDRAVLIEALAMIADERGWCIGEGRMGARVCSAEALVLTLRRRVTSELGMGYLGLDYEAMRRHPTYQALLDSMYGERDHDGTYGPYGQRLTPYDAVSEFNDHSSHDEVIAAWDYAIKQGVSE